MAVPSQMDDQKELSITLEVPLPPSLNRLWRIGKNRKTGKRFLMRSPEYERWLVDAGWILKAQLPKLSTKTIHGLYSLTVELSLGAASDMDNRIKAVSDLLQVHHIIDNDNLCRKLTVLWTEGLVGCRVEVRSIDLPSSACP